MQTVGHKKSCNVDCPPVTASQRRRQREERSKMLAEPVLEADKEKLAKKDNAAQKLLDNKQPQPLTTIVPSLLAVPALSTQNSCSGSCASGSISGKRRKIKNPLLTYEVNKKFLRIVERAVQQEVWNHKEILRWTDDTDKDSHHHVESYVQSFPRMAKLLALHDPPPSTSKLFERAWHHVAPGPTDEAAGDYFTYGQGCRGGRETWEKKYIDSMWRAAIIAWSAFQDEEHLNYFQGLRWWLDEQRSQELYDKAKELLLNDAYHQTSSTSGPFSRPSFVAAVKAVIEEGARRSSPRSGNNKAAASSLLSQNADDNDVPVISLDRLGVFSFKIRNKLLELVYMRSKLEGREFVRVERKTYGALVKKEIARLRSIGDAYGWDKITSLRIVGLPTTTP